MENNNKRRDFLKKSTGFIGLSILGVSAATGIPGCEKSEVSVSPEPETYEINVTTYPALAATGGIVQMYLKLNDGSEKNLMLIRKAQKNDKDDFTVLEAVCRHQNCSVTSPASLDDLIVCNCHGAKYSVDDGKLIDANGISGVPDLIKFVVFDFDAAKNILKVIV